MPKTKVGDRVRVTYEAEVVYRSPELLRLRGTKSKHAFDASRLPDNFKLEVLEPAVEVFQPGDIVEDKVTGFRFQLLPGNQYMNRVQAKVYDYSPGDFTSEWYTKVGHINELLKS